MKNLKFLAVSFLLFVGVQSVSAQQGRGFDKNRKQTEQGQKQFQEKRQKKMQEELSLTDDQIKNIEKIRSKKAGEIQKLREEIWSLKEEERKEVQATFTPEQKEKFEKLRMENKKGMRRGNRDNQDRSQLHKKKTEHKRHRR